MTKLRIAIADDQKLVRAGFALILGTQPDIEVVGEAGDGAGPSASCARLAPTWC